jgi:hypothetical protein
MSACQRSADEFIELAFGAVDPEPIDANAVDIQPTNQRLMHWL